MPNVAEVHRKRIKEADKHMPAALRNVMYIDHLHELEDADYEAERQYQYEQDQLYNVRRFYGLGNDCD